MRKPNIIDFQNIDSETGVLNIFEVQNQIDFDIKRVFILNDIKNDITRGNHAHKKTDQLLICLKGEIEIFTELPNGLKFNYILSNSRAGLFLPAEAWHFMNYKKNSIQLVCASQLYNENDYLRTKDQFEDYYKVIK